MRVAPRWSVGCSVVAAILFATSGRTVGAGQSTPVDVAPAGSTPLESTASPIIADVSPTTAAVGSLAPTTAVPGAEAAVPTCHATDLAAAFPDRNEATWRAPTVSTGYSKATDVILINRSRATCTLNGWVTLTMIGRDVLVYCAPSGYPGPSPCGGVVDKTSVRVPTIEHVPAGDVTTWVVRPGQTELFTVLYDDLLGSGVDCHTAWDEPVVVEFRISGDDRPIRLQQFPIGPCRGRIGLTAIGLRG